MHSLAIRLEPVKHESLYEHAQDAILLAGRLNAPVVFAFGPFTVKVTTSDSVVDVVTRYFNMTGEDQPEERAKRYVKHNMRKLEGQPNEPRAEARAAS